MPSKPNHQPDPTAAARLDALVGVAQQLKDALANGDAPSGVMLARLVVQTDKCVSQLGKYLPPESKAG